MRLACFALLVIACGSEREQAPLPAPLPTTPVDNAPPAPTVAPPRTVSVRSPFGDTQYAYNLMVDGDFEFTGRSGQMPWIAAMMNGQQTPLEYETGGRCRSGVRCGRIASGGLLLGHMATPKDGKIFVRAWIKPASMRCGDVKMVLLNGLTNGTVANAVSQTPGPDESGWCRFELVGNNVALGEPALYIVSNMTTATIDDVVATPTTGEKPNVGGAGITKAEEAIGLALLRAPRQRPIFPPPMDKPPKWEDFPTGAHP